MLLHLSIRNRVLPRAHVLVRDIGVHAYVHTVRKSEDRGALVIAPGGKKMTEKKEPH